MGIVEPERRLEGLQLGCAVFATFFIRFKANLSKFGPYSLHIRLFRYICIHHLFASFASYLLLIIQTDLHTNIRIHAKNTCCSEYSLQSEYRLRLSHTGDYLLQNIRLEANIRKTFSEFHIQVNICLQIFTHKRIIACKYSYTSEYSLRISSNYLGKPFTSLRPQLIFGSL